MNRNTVIMFLFIVFTSCKPDFFYSYKLPINKHDKIYCGIQFSDVVLKENKYYLYEMNGLQMGLLFLNVDLDSAHRVGNDSILCFSSVDIQRNNEGFFICDAELIEDKKWVVKDTIIQLFPNDKRLKSSEFGLATFTFKIQKKKKRTICIFSADKRELKYGIMLTLFCNF